MVQYLKNKNGKVHNNDHYKQRLTLRTSQLAGRKTTNYGIFPLMTVIKIFIFVSDMLQKGLSWLLSW